MIFKYAVLTLLWYKMKIVLYTFNDCFSYQTINTLSMKIIYFVSCNFHDYRILCDLFYIAKYFFHRNYPVFFCFLKQEANRPQRSPEYKNQYTNLSRRLIYGFKFHSGVEKNIMTTTSLPEVFQMGLWNL